jgi:hypothetical protein
MRTKHKDLLSEVLTWKENSECIDLNANLSFHSWLLPLRNKSSDNFTSIVISMLLLNRVHGWVFNALILWNKNEAVRTSFTWTQASRCGNTFAFSYTVLTSKSTFRSVIHGFDYGLLILFSTITDQLIIEASLIETPWSAAFDACTLCYPCLECYWPVTMAVAEALISETKYPFYCTARDETWLETSGGRIQLVRNLDHNPASDFDDIYPRVRMTFKVKNNTSESDCFVGGGGGGNDNRTHTAHRATSTGCGRVRFFLTKKANDPRNMYRKQRTH